MKFRKFSARIVRKACKLRLKSCYNCLRWNESKELTFICGNKMPTRCDRGFYCRSYCLLNMFRAPLCPSSGAQEYYTVVVNTWKKKWQLDATEVFIADLIACSTCFGHHYAHHQELKSIIQWSLPVVFGAVVFMLLVWCGADGYVSGLQDAAASCKPDT